MKFWRLKYSRSTFLAAGESAVLAAMALRSECYGHERLIGAEEATAADARLRYGKCLEGPAVLLEHAHYFYSPDDRPAWCMKCGELREKPPTPDLVESLREAAGPVEAETLTHTNAQCGPLESPQSELAGEGENTTSEKQNRAPAVPAGAGEEPGGLTPPPETTSALARPNGSKLRKLQLEVLEIFLRSPHPLTQEEVAITHADLHGSKSWSTARTRVSELAALGLLEKLDRRTRISTGSLAYLYRITDPGREYLEAGVDRQKQNNNNNNELMTNPPERNPVGGET